MWLSVVLLGLCTRSDHAGVTSFVRAGFLRDAAYRRLLHVFVSKGVCLATLTKCWVGLVLRLFRPIEVDGHLVVVADGLKIGKEGRRMPGVKMLHQESQNNSKPEYIMGHSFQAIGLLVMGKQAPVCVPLASRLHEGVKLGPGDTRTLLDKLVGLLLPLAALIEKRVILLADAFYASRKVVLPLLAAGHHLVTRVRTTAVAYYPAPQPEKRGRGRPRVYGQKVCLKNSWNLPDFVTATSPAYGEKNVMIRILVLDLLWRPVGRIVRFVLVDHPHRGRIILMTTHLGLSAIEVVRLYSYRFKIEVCFKQAVHTVGVRVPLLVESNAAPTPRRGQPVPAPSHPRVPCQRTPQTRRVRPARPTGLHRTRPPPTPRYQLSSERLGHVPQLDAHHAHRPDALGSRRRTSTTRRPARFSRGKWRRGHL